MKYKLIVSDVDGVWTDGSFYYSREGDDLRKFSTKDSYGVSLCRILEIPILIVSTEKNHMVEKRMEKLKIKHMRLGVRNKLQAITRFSKKIGIELSEVAFIGDDMNDLHLLGKVGLFACPADAYRIIKEKSDFVLKKKGGEGAFREFVEKLIQDEGKLEEIYAKYVDECLKIEE